MDTAPLNREESKFSLQFGSAGTSPSHFQITCAGKKSRSGRLENMAAVEGSDFFGFGGKATEFASKIGKDPLLTHQSTVLRSGRSSQIALSMEFTSTSSPDDVHAAFLRLFHDNEGRFRALTRTLVASNHDAQDIFQEAALTMFKKFPERDHNQDFVEWGFRVISFKVREWRQKKRRLKWQFSEETLRLITDDAEVVGQSWHARNIALSGCLERLNRQDRELLAQRYAEEGEIEEIAFATGRTVQAVYRKLSRLRQSLAECIKRAISQMNEDS